MQPRDVLSDSFDRIHEVVHRILDGAGDDELAWRPDPDANSVAWLVWHATRVSDVQVSDAVGHEQTWTADGFVTAFALPFDVGATGYGFSSADVGRVRASAADLRAYADAVHARTLDDVAALSADDLDQVVDERWDPPVTLGVRLVSTVADALQHAGQASYVRGLWRRR